MITDLIGLAWNVERIKDIEYKLVEDVQVEGKLAQRDFEYSGKRVSNLIMCMRKLAIPALLFQRNEPVDFISEETALYFSMGHALHEYYLDKFRSLGLIREQVFSRSTNNEDEIIGHVDLLTYDNKPMEFKPTRKAITEDGRNIPTHYIMQLGSYCWLVLSYVGYLIVLRIINPKFLVFKFTFTENFLDFVGYYLRYRHSMVKQVIDGKMDISELPRGSSWECKKCLYPDYCKMIDFVQQNKSLLQKRE